MSDKYTMFKNFLHNELGITKEDIREWVKESVREEARKVIKKTYDDFDVPRVCVNEMHYLLTSQSSSLHQAIFKAVAKELLKGITISIKETGND